MLNLKDIRDQIANLENEAESLLHIAKEDKRELTDEEQKRFDAITNDGGELEKLRAKEDAAFRREEFLRNKKAHEKVAAKMRAGELEPNENGGDNYKPTAIKIPAKAKASGKLKAFSGPDAERDAFVTGQFLVAAFGGNRHSQQWLSDHGYGEIVNAMSGSTNPSGGFIVPEEMARSITVLREARGVFPQYARRYPMSAEIVQVPRILSGHTAYWVGEGSTITSSDLTFGNAELYAKKIAGLAVISSELSESAAIDIADMVVDELAYSMATAIDQAAFIGDGTSTYGGVLGLKNALVDADPAAGGDGAIVNAASGNTAVTTLDLADFEAVIGAFPEYAGAQPRWYMHKAVFYAGPHRLMSAGGGNTIADLGMGAEREFLGYPVTFVQVMDSTTSVDAGVIKAYFGDMRLAATYGVHRGMRTEVSRDAYFTTDQIGIKCTERVAVNIHERGASIRQRPMIALQTADS